MSWATIPFKLIIAMLRWYIKIKYIYDLYESFNGKNWETLKCLTETGWFKILQ